MQTEHNMEPAKAARFRRTLVVANPKAKLFDQVTEVCRLLHYSRRTEQTYVGWIRRFLMFHRAKAAGQWRHPRDLGGQEVTEFLSHLAVAVQVSASTQNQALNAVVFLYREVLHRELTGLDERLRATRPKRLPVVLTREEVRQWLAMMEGTPKLMARLLYGTGMRLIELLRLRVKDVDFGRNQILIHAGKGNKDRVTMVPESLVELLRAHLVRRQQGHQADAACGQGRVWLPDGNDERMPPKGDRLSKPVADLIKRWIDQGAQN